MYVIVICIAIVLITAIICFTIVHINETIWTLQDKLCDTQERVTYYRDKCSKLTSSIYKIIAYKEDALIKSSESYYNELSEIIKNI